MAFSDYKDFDANVVNDFGILAYGRFAQNLMTSNSKDICDNSYN